ncbi:toll-like receptor 4 [Biomphalaria glabrata]|uniref:Toll-like receptor 4 n=1 Tax=Biomphalaria glabrata TaxID=6526 RepID=A0A9W2YWQ2_BIOGL|nr:toll-like receptor 4 [Biomphalaria glabrata]
MTLLKVFIILLSFTLTCCFLRHCTVLAQGQKNKSHTAKNPCDVMDYSDVTGIETIVNCSMRSLQFISKSWFLENTSELMLQNNLLTFVPNSTLNSLSKLKQLSLQDNLLSYIQPKAFEGLVSLQYLNLENNRLNLFSLPVDVFSDLISLTELRIIQPTENVQRVYNVSNHSRQTTTASFPDGMFTALNNLTNLSASVFGQVLYFNKDFIDLKKLTGLEITGNVKIINEFSFENIKTIQNLSLFQFNDIANMSDLVLGSFSNLSYVTYNLIHTGLHAALDTLRPLVNSNVRLIKFEQVQKVPGLKYVSLLTRDGFLDVTSTRYLRQICVEELQLNRNSIFVIDFGTFSGETFNRCLKSIYLINNPLIGTIMAFTEGLTLHNLNKFVITGSFVRENGLDDGDSQISKYRLYSSSKNELDMNNNLSTSLGNLDNVKETTVQISKSIEYVDVSSVFGESHLNKRVTIRGGENVKFVRLVDDGIKFVEFPIEGLPNIQVFVLSFNKMYILEPDFFNAYPSLVTLRIDSCRLVSSFVSQYSARMFRNLTRLQNLDLSYNSLEILEPKTFAVNPLLVTLNISGNRFKQIPFDLVLTPKLQLLDVRENVLTSISQEDRNLIEGHKERLGKFQLLLAGNIFSCGCENLQFLQWLHFTDVELDNNKNFTCISRTGVLSSTLAYLDHAGLWRECWGQVCFNVSLGLLCFTLIGFVLVFVWSRNKILIQSRLLQIFTGLKFNTLADYKYGAFIGYSDIDYHFACFPLRQYIENDLGLVTFLQDRDLSPSLAYADGIMEAINSSWRIIKRTLPVYKVGYGLINENFVIQNEWFLFTVRSAIYAMSPANPNRVVILVDAKSMHHLPTEILNSVPEDSIIQISRWEMDYNLRQSLKTRLVQ